MREIHDHDELLAACRGDLPCVWAARGLSGLARAFVSEDGMAVAVAAPDLSQRDRLAVWGAPEAAVPLIGDVLAEVGPSYRLFGDPEVIDELVDAVPGLAAVKDFGWMYATQSPDRQSPDASKAVAIPTQRRAGWLSPAALPEVTLLLDGAFPASYARPGRPVGAQWAGARDIGGALAAVAALAWSAPTVGLLAGVAVSAAARGRGLGHQVCRFVVDAALRRHGAVALMVDRANEPAIRLYRGLGLRYRTVRAAAMTTT